mgnify:CR=1 FL=1
MRRDRPDSAGIEQDTCTLGRITPAPTGTTESASIWHHTLTLTYPACGGRCILCRPMLPLSGNTSRLPRIRCRRTQTIPGRSEALGKELASYPDNKTPDGFRCKAASGINGQGRPGAPASSWSQSPRYKAAGLSSASLLPPIPGLYGLGSLRYRRHFCVSR